MARITFPETSLKLERNMLVGRRPFPFWADFFFAGRMSASGSVTKYPPERQDASFDSQF